MATLGRNSSAGISKMAAPTSAQKTKMANLVGESGTQIYGFYVGGIVPQYGHPMGIAMNTACNDANFGIPLSEALTIYTGYLLWNDMAGGTLVPDSSSDDMMLAFAGRIREIYAIQNP